MTGNKRLKISIFSLIAVAVLFVTAVFSVSYAKWSGGSTEATAKGSVGKYYVEYPSNIAFDDDTYYLQVSASGEESAEYYAMRLNAGAANKTEYFVGVEISGAKTVKIFKGKTQQPIVENSASRGVIYGTDSLTTTASGDNLYTFYYTTQSTVAGDTNKLYASFAEFHSDLTLEFSDGDIVLDVFLDDGSLTDSSIKSRSFYVYMQNTGVTPVDYISGAYPGKIMKETKRLDASKYASDTETINFTFGRYHDNAQTMYGGIKLSELCPNGIGEYNIVFTYIKTDTGGYYGYATHSVAAVIGPTDPTDSAVDAVVRKVSASTNADNSYTYKNYVCVSREYLATQTDKTAAYINFGVEGIGGDPLSANVTSFTVKRAATDADGNVAAGDGTAEFVYNSPEGKTLADINAKPPAGEQTGEHLKNNYVIGGTYVMLYFGEGKDRYYALDVTITTDSPANFTLTATASNVDRRHRYKTGYGEKLGYYLGGEFNGMDMWNPRFAAKLEKNGTYAEDAVSLAYKDGDKYIAYSGPSYVDVSLTIQLTAANDTVKLFRLNNSDGKRENGAAPTLWFIPHHIHKNYTDGIGVDEEKNLFNADMNLIVAVPGTYRLHYVGNVTYKSDDFFAYDRTERVYLTRTEYYSLYKGDNASATDRQKEQWIDENEKTHDGTKRYTLLGNWNGVVDSLYVERIGGENLIENVTVTFDENGGTWDVTDNTETVKWGATLAENGLIRRQPTPPDGKMFDGWYDSNGKQYDATTKIAPSSATLTLTARWVDRAAHTVTFHYNYEGAPNDGVYATVEVDDRSVIEESKKPAAPARIGYTFGGWYKEAGCINAWDFASDIVTSTAKNLYAKWDPIKYTVKFDVNGYVGTDTDIEATYGGVITEAQAVKPDLQSGLSSDLYEFGWYTTASGDTKVTFPLTVSGNVTYYARYVANKVRIVLDATNWLGDNDTDIYHIYAYKSTVELSGTWSNRASMTAIGENKYSIVLTDLPTDIIFTRDAVDSRNEVSRYTVSSTGIQLGHEYVYEAKMIKFVFDTTWGDWPNDAKIQYTLSDGNVSDWLSFIQTDRQAAHLSGYKYIQVPSSVTVQFLQYPNGQTWAVKCTQASSYTYEAGATYKMTSVNFKSDDSTNKVKSATFTVVKS